MVNNVDMNTDIQVSEFYTFFNLVFPQYWWGGVWVEKC